MNDTNPFSISSSTASDAAPGATLNATPSAERFRLLLGRAVRLPVLVMAVVSLVLILQTALLLSLTGWVEQTNVALSRANDLQKFTYERGLAVHDFFKGGRLSLRDFRRDSALWQSDFAVLRRGSNKDGVEDSEQAQRLADIAAAHEKWDAFVRGLLAAPLADSRREAMGARERVLMRNLHAAFDEYLRAGRALRAERLARAHYGTAWVLGSAMVLSLCAGALLALGSRRHLLEARRLYGAALDTAHEQAEQLVLRACELSASEERYRLLAEAGPHFVWVNSAEGETVFVNRRWTDFTGLTCEQTAGRGWSEILHPDDRDRVMASYRKALAQGTMHETELRYRNRDGEYRWHLARSLPVRDEAGNIVQWLGVAMDMHGQKQAEAHLRESEERYRVLVEASAQMVWMTDADYQTIYVSPRWIEFTGLSREATQNQGWQQAIHPDDLPRILDDGETVRDGQPIEIEYRLRRHDGAYRWVLARGLPVRDPQGQITNWIVAAIDVHDSREAARAIALSEKRYRALAEASAQVVWTADAEGKSRDGGAWMQEFIGVPRPPEGTPGWWFGAIHPDDRPLIESELLANQQQGRGFDVLLRMRRHDGVYRNLRLRSVPVCDDAGAFREWVGTISDETQRVQTLNALHESEARFRTMSDTAPVFIWTARPDKLVDYFNKPWLDFRGRTLEEEQGTGWTEGVHPDDLPTGLQVYETAFDAQREFKFEYRLRRYDGAYRWVLVHGVPRFAPDGEFLGYIGSCIDIEERKRTEEERDRLLQEAREASRLKDEFLAVVSHELRTPLNAILGWAHLINKGALQADEVTHACEVIERNARAQAQIVEDILDVARIVTGKLRIEAVAVDLPSIAREVLESIMPAAQAKSISLSATLPDDLPPVCGDAGRLRQVIWNLFSNAVKFTPSGGCVGVRLVEENGVARLAISDSGQGIAPEFLPHVFDRFRQAEGGATRRHGGLGLGLALVRHLVEAHGGSVHADSPGPGQGATFTIEVPLFANVVHPVEGEAAPQNLPTHSGLLKGVKILVADDAPDALRLASTILQQAGAHVETACDAAQAREKFAAHRPHLLLSDIGMPGEDGYALLQWLRAQNHDGAVPPAIALTAYASADERSRAETAGFAAFLSKPLDAETLVGTVARVLQTGEANEVVL